MPDATSPATVELTLADGSSIRVAASIADRVRGIDADGDLLISQRAEPVWSQIGTEPLTPLTHCCTAIGKGSAYFGTTVECGRCHRDVHYKYGGSSRLAVGLAATVSTASPCGPSGHVLTLTATAVDGPCSQRVVGASDREHRELRERLKAAVRNSGLPAVHRRSVMLRLDPPYSTLPCVTAAAVAVAAIAAAEEISTLRLAGTAVLGDVGLDSSLRATGDVLTAVRTARTLGIRQVIVPAACRAEAELVDEVHVLGVHRLSEITDWMRGGEITSTNAPR